MLPFNHNEALKGKVCKTQSGDFVIIVADVTKNEHYKFSEDYPLLGFR
nr:MAG TPA: hypothetical protein [Caudoviricetes sp.]